MARCFLLFIALSCVPLTAQTPTVDQMLGFRTPAGAVISPDGKYVAYVVSETNWEENEFQTEIWVYSSVTGERYQLTSGKKSSSSPSWAPDGKRLAFASDRDGKRQIYLISPAGGEAVPLTADEGGVASFEWAPDGKRIAFVSTGPEPKPLKDRKDRYGDFEIVQQDYRHQHIFLVNVPEDYTGKEKPKPQQISSGEDFSVGAISWSPDGKTIAFSAGRDPDLSSSHTVDLYTVRLSDRFVRKLVSTSGPDNNPVWSPDGRFIAYQTANGQEYYYYTNHKVAVIAADGGAPRVLNMPFDEQPSLIGWGPDGIYFSGLQRTHGYVFRANPETGAVARVLGNETLWPGGASFSRDFKEAAFTGSGPNQFGEVYASPVASFTPRKLTDFAAQYKEFRFAKRELIQWKSTDGTAIEGVLIKPADYDPTKKYPLLVVIHGGPTGIDRPQLGPDRTYPIEMFAAKGALVLRPNYRGSAGYGEKFRSLNVRNLGVGDAWDVISGVDHLIAKGIVDKDRVGAMGWSQGGYISAFLTCSSDRFKAISVGAGISDWMTYYVNTDIHPFTRQYLKATPWEDPEIYRKTSPISYVRAAKTPTLIQHGENDRRVPLPNAYELYQALQDQGVPARLVVYKGFGHGINKPKQQRHVMEQNYEWFSQYIWNEKPAGSGGPSQPSAGR